MYNKKANLGEGAMVLLIAAMLFAGGMIFLNPLKESIDTFRTDIECSSATISDGSKVLCLGGDLGIPLFVLAVLSLSGGIVTAKWLI